VFWICLSLREAIRASLRMVGRVRPMVGKLGVKPGVNGGDQFNVAGCIENLRAVWQLTVGNLDALRAQHQLVQTGHILAVDHRRVVKVAMTETLGLFPQMGVNQADLFVVGDYLLKTPSSRFSKMWVGARPLRVGGSANRAERTFYALQCASMIHCAASATSAPGLLGDAPYMRAAM
jgi:hypothetical protein